MKRCLLLIFVISILMLLATNMIFAEFGDIAANASYKTAIDHVSALGIMNGYDDGLFYPNNLVTREQFAKIIVSSAGLDDKAQVLKRTSAFPDVSPDRWSAQYIQEALNKGYITGMPDGCFHPFDNITFAQACTVFVKLLGYTDSNDVPGVWPTNYIEMANTQDLTTGLSLNYNDYVSRWAIAVMIENLLEADIKPATPQSTAKTFAENNSLFTECIIFDNSTTSDELAANQVSTDQGTFYIVDTSKPLILGTQYRLKIQNGEYIETIYDQVNPVKNVTVNSYVGTQINYTENNGNVQMVLPQSTTYYYNGTKQAYSTLNTLLNKNSSIVFTYNSNQSGFDYAIIYDPQYQEPDIFLKNGDQSNLSSLNLNKNLALVRESGTEEDTITANDLNDKDVIYRVTDIWGTNSYYVVLTSKVEGTIDSILPYKLTPKSIVIDGTTYMFNKYLDVSKVVTSSFINNNDKVCAVLGYDGKILDIFPYTYKTSPYVQHVILGDSRTIDTLAEGQVMTDQGVYTMLDPNTTFKIGNRYWLVTDGDIVTVVGNTLRTTFSVTVQNFVDTTITYRQGQETKTMDLPDITTYYYQGTQQTFANITNLLRLDTTIIFSNNTSNTGYDVAIIVDPIYSKPEIALNVDANTTNLGKIEFSSGVPILMDGKQIVVSDIEDRDVVYNVTDLDGNNRYIGVFDSRAEGMITNILPTKLAPTGIKIDENTYGFNKYMNLSKITNSMGSFNIDDNVSALLGYDGKIVDIYPLTYKEGPDTEHLILGDARTIPTLSDNQIETDKGIYYLLNPNNEPQIGNEYELRTGDDVLVKVGDKLTTTTSITIQNSIGTTVIYNDNNGQTQTLVLPEDPIYYYQGVKQAYEAIPNLLQLDTTIIFQNNDANAGYTYGIIIDPIYSNPEVSINFNPAFPKIGIIDLNTVTIIRDEKQITVNDIEEKDVLYNVTDVWNNNRYVLVIDNKAEGTLRMFYPVNYHQNHYRLMRIPIVLASI